MSACAREIETLEFDFSTEAFSCGSAPYYSNSSTSSVETNTSTQSTFIQGSMTTCTNSTYLYIVQSEAHTTSIATIGLWRTLTLDTSGGGLEITSQNTGSRRFHNHFEIQTGAAGTKSVQGNISCLGSCSPTGAMNASEGLFIGVELDNSSSQNYNTSFDFSGTSVDNVFGDATDSLNTTLVVSSTGDYLIMGRGMLRETSTSNQTAARLVVNSSLILPSNNTDQYSRVRYEPVVSGLDQPFNIVSVQTLAPATYRLSLQVADTDGASTSVFRNNSLMAIRLSPFSRYYYNQSSSYQLLDTTNLLTVRSLVIPARGSTNRTFFIVVNTYVNGTAGVAVNANVSIDNVRQGQQEIIYLKDSTEQVSLTRFLIANLNASAHTVTLGMEGGSGSTVFFAKDALILAVELNASNSAPVVNLAQITNTSAYQGATLRAYCNVSDSDGDTVNVSWTVRANTTMLANGSSGFVTVGNISVYNWTANASTYYNLTCNASDGIASSAQSNFTSGVFSSTPQPVLCANMSGINFYPSVRYFNRTNGKLLQYNISVANQTSCLCAYSLDLTSVPFSENVSFSWNNTNTTYVLKVNALTLPRNLTVSNGTLGCFNLTMDYINATRSLGNFTLNVSAVRI
jgi:hypothetical protein